LLTSAEHRLKSKFGNLGEETTKPDAPAVRDALQGWYLLRSFSNSTDVGSMDSLMDLPPEAAVKKMEEIHPHRGSGPADENGNRPQAAYYQERKEADDWLRRSASELDGVGMERKNPVFFAFTNDPDTVLKAMTSGRGNDVLVVPLEKADLSKFSFTFGDSMGNHLLLQGKEAFLSARHDMNGQVMNAQSLAEAVKKHGIGADGIEAHYWSEKQPDGMIVKGLPAAPKQDAMPLASAPTAKIATGKHTP